MKGSRFFVFVIALAYAALTLGFNFLPRSRVSQLEKRELQRFPSFSRDALADGSFTAAVSSWYSDTEPFRDTLMEWGMLFRHWEGLHLGGPQIEFLPAGEPLGEAERSEAAQDSLKPVNAAAYVEVEGGAADIAKVPDTGIILVGSGDSLRALIGFFGTEAGGEKYAATVNAYGAAFGDAVQLWCMPIPTSTEFYCPEKAARFTKRQAPVFNSIFSHLSDGVKPVDCYSVLADHTDEPIYLRTDHHWSPLGAYYAAEEFARVARVPFRDLSAYEEHVVHNFVGSMYGYTQSAALKRAPEDFVYYVPTQVDYETTYIDYELDEEYHVTGETRPYKNKYFFAYKDGSGGAYSTFMGGDVKQVKVKTSTHNGRRLLVIKDSFGNAVPGYLFYSFEEIHVADFRYFTKSVVDFVDENHITDILLAMNITNTCVPYTLSRLRKFLNPTDPGLSAFRIDTVSTALQERMRGRSYPEGEAEIGFSELRHLQLLYYDYNGRVRKGEMVCNQAIADDLIHIFKELYKARYPIAGIRLADDFDGDDLRSMEANNSSCFNYRTKTTGASLSRHAFGMAVDINPLENPYVKGEVVEPPSAAGYADRSLDFPHKITADDLCCRLFRSRGFRWGGDWNSLKDYQHFEK